MVYPGLGWAGPGGQLWATRLARLLIPSPPTRTADAVNCKRVRATSAGPAGARVCVLRVGGGGKTSTEPAQLEKLGPLGFPPAPRREPRGASSTTFPRSPPPPIPAPSVFWSRTGSVSHRGHWLLGASESGDWLSLAVAQAPSRRWSEVGRGQPGPGSEGR